jgi:uncharacterized RDD family membrane protein YckC
MKCPKCAYIGYDAGDRCRNCGYEFALANPAQPATELSMRAANDSGGPLPDLSLKPRSTESRPTPSGAPLDLDRLIGVPEPSSDLPLFSAGDEAADDLPPLVTPSQTPRRPLAVRRPTPDPARLRPRAREESRERTPTLDLSAPAEPPAPPRAPAPRSAVRSTPAPAVLSVPVAPVAASVDATPVAETAGLAARLVAALIDLIILGTIDALTMYFTLRLCGLTTGEWRILPILPIAVFFLVVNGGYLIAFTAAGGQTMGKMATGLRVVGGSNGPVSVGVATIRAIACLASTVCLGAGFLPAVLGGDGRALQDRLADTRVVRQTT